MTDLGERTVTELTSDRREITVNAAQIEFLRAAGQELDRLGYRIYPAIIGQIVDRFDTVRADTVVTDDGVVLAALLHYGLDNGDTAGLVIDALERRGWKDAAEVLRVHARNAA